MNNQRAVYEMWSQPTSVESVVAFVCEALATRTGEQSADARLAYDLAGLMELDTARNLRPDHPLAQALLTFGQLELPEAHRDPLASWERAENLIVEAQN